MRRFTWQSPQTLLVAAAVLLLLLCCAGIVAAQPLPSSQAKTLLRVRRLLEYPASMSPLAAAGADPCALPPSPSLAISCSNAQITGISVVGDRAPTPAWDTALPANFSADALFTTLSRIASLTDLSLVALGLWGPLPGAKLHRLQALRALNVSSNYFYGAIPPQLAEMYALESLVLARNLLNATVPSLAGLGFLQVFDAGHNRLGPEFPAVGKNLVRLAVANNQFRCKVPEGLSSLGQLQFLDLSANQFSGWIPSSLFALPALQYINVSHNRLAGQLPASLACADALATVDVSSNLLSGARPACIRSNSSARTVLDAGNCFADAGLQRPSSSCNPGALAAVLPPPQWSGGRPGGEKGGGLGLVLGIVGGVVGGAVLIALVMVVVLRRAKKQHPDVGILPAPLPPKSPKMGDGRKGPAQMSPRITPAEKRHASHAARVSALEVTPYRVFTLEELEEATNNFDSSNLIKNTPHAQHYKGWLQDGSMVLVRCQRLKLKYSPQSLVHCMEVVAKLRHRHLVSIIGHCIADDPENPNTAGSVYLVSECISNGDLRSHLTEWRKREMLKWPQRIAAAVGVARGIQFLHNVAAPGIVGNDLNIENILLDKTLTAKISNYNLPVLSTNKNGKVAMDSPFAVDEDNDLVSAHSAEQGGKEDIYHLGLILLEIITGKPSESETQLDSLKALLSKALTEDSDRMKEMADPAIRGTFAVDSLVTVTEIALKCAASDPKDRPSIDDVLWNLQYSMQVQEGWASSESLSVSLSFKS